MKDMKAPINTTRQVSENPLHFLLGALSPGGTSAAIESQEASGQRQLAGSDVLPVQMNSDDLGALEAAGVKFHGVVPGDEIFQYATLPDGWKKVPTDHSMWSDLVDDKGRKRGGIFYKAAFYDRSSHLSMQTRYQAGRDYNRTDYDKVAVGQVIDRGDGDKVIFSTEEVSLPEGRERWTIAEEVVARAVAWMKENFPESSSLTAYWD